MSRALARTGADSAAWEEVCDCLADLVGGVGASFNAITSSIPPAVYPSSRSLAPFLQTLTNDGWHKQSPRKKKGFPALIAKGTFTEADFMTDEEMRTDPFYSEFLQAMGLKWVVGLGFNVGGQIWCAAVQGSDRRGPFSAAEIARLVDCRAELEVAAQRSANLGILRLEAQLDWSERTHRGVIGFNSEGQVRSVSPTAIGLLSRELSVEQAKLRAANKDEDKAVQQLIYSGVRHALNNQMPQPEPLVVSISEGARLVLDAIPLPSDAYTVFSDTVLLVTVRRASKLPDLSKTLGRRFGLSQREAEIAVALSEGATVNEVAENLSIKISTVRSHLHTIFLKTETKRQAALVALVNKA